MSQIRVQKFGGAGLSTIGKVKSVARHLSEIHKAGQSVIAVVSAMGTATNELISKAYKISDHPDKRELDMLVSTGERVSMSLLTMALKDLGCNAVSFTGSQAGIMTDGEHSSAEILEVKPIRVEEAIGNNKVVVIAGFQGVDPQTKEITTLGRGGTDTTAVALAGHFKAERCEIIKEVPGICSADPRLVSHIEVIPQISYELMESMCFWGTKALHHRCVNLAKRLNIPIWVGPIKSKMSEGTLVSREGRGLVLSHMDNIFAVKCQDPDEVLRVFEKQNWTAPRFLYQKNSLCLLQGDQHLTETLLKKNSLEIAWSQHSAVTLTGSDQKIDWSSLGTKVSFETGPSQVGIFSTGEANKVIKKLASKFL